MEVTPAAFRLKVETMFGPDLKKCSPTQDYDFKHSAVDHLTCVGSNLIYNEIEAGGSCLSKKLKTGLITW